jgi:hypothetical protein
MAELELGKARAEDIDRLHFEAHHAAAAGGGRNGGHRGRLCRPGRGDEWARLGDDLVEGVAGSHCQLRQVVGRAVLLLWSVLVVGELCPHTRVAFCGNCDTVRHPGSKSSFWPKRTSRVG